MVVLVVAVAVVVVMVLAVVLAPELVLALLLVERRGSECDGGEAEGTAGAALGDGAAVSCVFQCHDART